MACSVLQSCGPTMYSLGPCHCLGDAQFSRPVLPPTTATIHLSDVPSVRRDANRALSSLKKLVDTIVTTSPSATNTLLSSIDTLPSVIHIETEGRDHQDDSILKSAFWSSFIGINFNMEESIDRAGKQPEPGVYFGIKARLARIAAAMTPSRPLPDFIEMFLGLTNLDFYTIPRKAKNTERSSKPNDAAVKSILLFLTIFVSLITGILLLSIFSSSALYRITSGQAVADAISAFGLLLKLPKIVSLYLDPVSLSYGHIMPSKFEILYYIMAIKASQYEDRMTDQIERFRRQYHRDIATRDHVKLCEWLICASCTLSLTPTLLRDLRGQYAGNSIDLTFLSPLLLMLGSLTVLNTLMVWLHYTYFPRRNLPGDQVQEDKAGDQDAIQHSSDEDSDESNTNTDGESDDESEHESEDERRVGSKDLRDIFLQRPRSTVVFGHRSPGELDAITEHDDEQSDIDFDFE